MRGAGAWAEVRRYVVRINMLCTAWERNSQGTELVDRVRVWGGGAVSYVIASRGGGGSWERVRHSKFRSHGQSSHGYTHHIGGPRRTAQEQVRTMMSRTASTLHALGETTKYFADLLVDKEEPGPPGLKWALRLQKSWKERAPPLACEILGCLQLMVVSILCLGAHLEVFKRRSMHQRQDS